jgi:hypothetical protein
MLLLRTQGVVLRKADPPPYVSMWLEGDDNTQQTTTPKRRMSAEPSMTLPANPFAEVPPQALSYFVDWAIERATDARRRGPSRTSFARVKMRPNRRDSPLKRARVAVAFSGGLATGLVLLLFAGPPKRADATNATNATNAIVRNDRLATPAELAAREVARTPGVGGNAAVPATATAIATPAAAVATTTMEPAASTAPSNALSSLIARNAAAAQSLPVAKPATSAAPNSIAPPALSLAPKPTLLALAAPSLRATTTDAPPPNTKASAATTAPGEAAAEPSGDATGDELDAPTPPVRPNASNAKKVPLVVTSTPPGWVEVDGRRRGRSPLTTAVEAGPHEVVIERPRYLTAHEHVDGPGKLAVELIRPPATLHVTSSPSGAMVRVDGHIAGNTPVNLTLTGYEQHKVEVELNGKTLRRKVYLRPPLASVDFEIAANALPVSRSSQLDKHSERSPRPSVLLASP